MADPQAVQIRAASVSDQAANKDSLGFDPYVIAIADFLTESETKPPLTLSVEGAWGSGKSSFMKQLEQEIARQSKEKSKEKLRAKRKDLGDKFRNLPFEFWKQLKELCEKFVGNLAPLLKPFKPISLNFYYFKELLISLIKFEINFLAVFLIFLIGVPLFLLLTVIRALVIIWKIIALTREIWFPHKPRVVWFNAWRHDKADALWAAFALTFLEEISKQRHVFDVLPPLFGYFKLFWSRFEKSFLSFFDLVRKLLQLLLLISAIALIVIFIIFRSYGWADKLANNLNDIADNLGRSLKPAQVISGDEANKVVYQLHCDIPSPNAEKNSTCQLTEKAKDNSAGKNQIESRSKQESNASSDEKKDEDKSASLLFWIKNSFIGTLIGTGGLSVLWLWQKFQKMIGSPKKELTDYLKSPNYDDQVSFIEKFHKDFRKIVEAYAGKGKKVYVFIDDLDRCEVPKSAELMQAINLMISNDPQLIFILGMDREKVAAGLAVKHKDVIPYLFSSVKTEIQSQNGQKQGDQSSLKGIEYGYTFIEKFVQLPFQVPRPNKEQFDQFLNNLSSTEQPQNTLWQSVWNFFWKPIQNNLNRFDRWISSQKPDLSEELSGGTETSAQTSETTVAQQVERRIETIKLKTNTGSESSEIHNILEMVAPALDWNPRRLKQFLNLFRLRAYIASATGLFDQVGESPALTLQQLGKFTAIGIKWPLLMIELAKDEDLLANLHKKKYDSTTTYWGSERKLLELLFDRAEDSAYSLEQVKVQKLLQVVPLHPLDLIPLLSKRNVDYSNLRNLLKYGQWRAADEETYRVMLKAANRESQGYLGIADIKQFPCEDLQTIDKLWVTASRGKFGFSVQKRIWQECGSPMEYNANWKKFGELVGWHGSARSDYSELAFDTQKSPTGELPWILGWGEEGRRRLGISSLFSRRDLPTVTRAGSERF